MAFFFKPILTGNKMTVLFLVNCELQKGYSNLACVFCQTMFVLDV